MKKKVDITCMHRGVLDDLIKHLEENDSEYVLKVLQKRRVGLLSKREKKEYYNKQRGFAFQNSKKKAEEFRAELIQKQTYAEKALKIFLKECDINYKFQHILYYEGVTGVKFFIVDFFLPKENVVLEVDGGYHNEKEQKKLDKKRTSILKANGVGKIYRFTNISIEKESDYILSRLKEIKKAYYKTYHKHKIAVKHKKSIKAL